MLLDVIPVPFTTSSWSCFRQEWTPYFNTTLFPKKGFDVWNYNLDRSVLVVFWLVVSDKASTKTTTSLASFSLTPSGSFCSSWNPPYKEHYNQSVSEHKCILRIIEFSSCALWSCRGTSALPYKRLPENG
jgi:hypothetical protein